MKKQRKRRMKAGALLSLLMFILHYVMPIGSIPVSGAEINNYPNGYKGVGDISHYNGIVFGNHNLVGADTEGALAVGGNLNIESGYSIAGNKDYKPGIQVGVEYEDEGNPSLLLGGTLNKGSNGYFAVYGDYATINKDGDPGNALKAGETEWLKSIIREPEEVMKEAFSKLKGQANDYVGKLKTLKYKEGTAIENASFSIGESDNSKILISNIDSKTEKLEFNEAFLPNLDDKEFLVIYSDAKQVKFGEWGINYDDNNDKVYQSNEKLNATASESGSESDRKQNEMLKKVASKIIWVFPNATEIKTRAVIPGTVIALNASVDASTGSVNGQLFCKDLKQTGGFELHNFRTNWGGLDKLFVEESGSVELTKVDNKTNEKLEGVMFNLYNENNQLLGEYKTNKDGLIKIENLAYGKYYFVEKEALQGYILNDEKYSFEVSEANIKSTILVKNVKKQSGSIKIIKSNEDGSKLLQGAMFELKDSNNNPINLDRELISDSDGEIIINNLPIGSYKLYEVEPPDGYQLLDQPIEFTIKEGQTEILTINVTNKMVLGKVELTKMDKVTKKTLSGGTFNLYDKDGTFIDTYITNDDGKILISNLKPGNYTFVESKAPVGYKLDTTPISFTIALGQIDTIKLEAFNVLSTGSVVLVKTDDENESIFLEGTEFGLYDSKGKLVDTFTTDINGEINVEGLSLGEYYFMELKASEGYELSTEKYNFTILEDKVSQVKVSNKKISGGENPGNPGENPGGGENPGNPGENPGGGENPGNPGENPGGGENPGNPGENPGGGENPGNPGENPGGGENSGNPGENPGGGESPGNPGGNSDNQSGEESNNISTPKTGDNSNLLKVILILLLSISTVVGAIFTRRKENKQRI